MVPIPTKPPTPAEYKVIIVVLAIISIVGGIAGVTAGLLAPANKHDLAVIAIRFGAGMLAIGALLLLALWCVRRLLDD